MKQSNSLSLSEVITHFEAWRSTRTGKSRIPAHLWQEALDLYPSYTITEITKPLRLGHTDFKKKIAQYHQELAPTDFIRIDQTSCKMDVSVAVNTTHQASTIELEKGDGTRLRIQRDLNDQALLSIINGYFGGSSCYS